MYRWIRSCALAVGLLASVSPAAAQWLPVDGVPAARIVEVFAQGDTIVAGADSLVYVSTDAGANWQESAKVVANARLIQSLLVRNGRLYAGTAGKGVFISDNLGASWQAYNQGLVGGLFDTQLDVSDLVVRGDSIYAGTFGAGVYVRGLVGATTWHHFGEEFEPNQASNVNQLALGGTRLLAAAGGNGSVLFREPGDPEWTISWLNNVGLSPGREARSAIWTGNGWVVGTVTGMFRSVLGQEPWTPSGPGLGALQHSAFAVRGSHLFAAFAAISNNVLVSVIEHSGDDGANLDVLEVLPGVFVFKMATVGNDLYAGRQDGLWRRSTATVSVPEGGARHALRFALAGAQPARDVVRFRFALPEPGAAAIEVFDLAGRRVAVPVHETLSAGAHEASWNARNLAPGVYEARLLAGGRGDVVRVIHVR